ncbi:MAG: ATP-binding cassette domain-containing protein [Meiothermus sp.]|nr:ATP-binding cassette domain-containing protein [Meiothermus sp.]
MLQRPDVALRLTEGEKLFGERALFRGANFWLEPRERAVLIGANGSGKSTLFQCLAGRNTLDGGRLERPRSASVVYLPQDFRPPLEGVTVHQSAYRITPLYRAERELEAAPPEQAGEFWARVNEYSFWRGRVAKVLADFGLQDKWESPVEGLSGGEGVRLGLAMTFLSGAEVLLLDEPTTHLDLRMRLRLEELLLYYPGAVAMISHDRALVARVAQTVYHLEEARLFRVAGGYNVYLQERERIKRTVEKARHEAEKERRRLLDELPDRRRPGSDRRANQRLALQSRAERIQTPDPLPPERRWSLELAAEGTPKLVLEAKGLVKGYAVGGRGRPTGNEEQGTLETRGYQPQTSSPPSGTRREVIQDASLRIFRGDRIALVGANGSGKTTLLRLLLSREFPDAGERVLGNGVSVAYLDQLYHGLAPDAPLFAQFRGRFGDSRAAALLGRVGFRPPRWDDPPKSFSGGERARAGLALLGALRAGLLVMDEPTNHIELELLEALERALTDYPGTLLFVSHDRVLVKKVATRFWGLEGGVLVEYPSYAEAEAAMLGRPATRLNPYGEFTPEPERPPEQRDLEDERIALLQRLEDSELSERGQIRLRADLLATEEALYRQYAAQFYRPFSYRFKVRQAGLEVFADHEADLWQFWTPGGQFLEAEQQGRVFGLSGRPGKRFLRAMLRILFEFADAQVVRLGEQTFGRAGYLQQLGLPKEPVGEAKASPKSRRKRGKRAGVGSPSSRPGENRSA